MADFLKVKIQENKDWNIIIFIFICYCELLKSKKTRIEISLALFRIVVSPALS